MSPSPSPSTRPARIIAGRAWGPAAENYKERIERKEGKKAKGRKRDERGRERERSPSTKETQNLFTKLWPSPSALNHFLRHRHSHKNHAGHWQGRLHHKDGGCQLRGSGGSGIGSHDTVQIHGDCCILQGFVPGRLFLGFVTRAYRELR